MEIYSHKICNNRLQILRLMTHSSTTFCVTHDFIMVLTCFATHGIDKNFDGLVCFDHLETGVTLKGFHLEKSKIPQNLSCRH